MRVAGEYHAASHPELIARTQYAQEAMLECLIALCKHSGIPAEDIPDPLTRLTDDYLSDLCHLAEIDLAERERQKRDAENR